MNNYDEQINQLVKEWFGEHVITVEEQLKQLLQEVDRLARVDELGNLPQDRIAATNPDRKTVTIVSEWVPGSAVNNRLQQLSKGDKHE